MSQLAASAEPRTQPWQQDELCSVGRLRCAYTFDAAGRLTVRLPGGPPRPWRSCAGAGTSSSCLGESADGAAHEPAADATDGRATAATDGQDRS